MIYNNHSMLYTLTNEMIAYIDVFAASMERSILGQVVDVDGDWSTHLPMI